MKKLLILFGAALISLTSFGQIIFSRLVKGDWTSYQVCMIPTETTPTIPGATVAYNIDNYHFNINIRNFLWTKRYVLTTTNNSDIYNISKGKYTFVDIANTGNDGEVIGRIYVPELRMESGKCNFLLNPSTITTYTVITHRQGYLMIWIPTPVNSEDINYTDIYLHTIYWTKKKSIPAPQIEPFPYNIIIAALKNEKDN